MMNKVEIVNAPSAPVLVPVNKMEPGQVGRIRTGSIVHTGELVLRSFSGLILLSNPAKDWLIHDHNVTHPIMIELVPAGTILQITVGVLQ